MYRVLYRYTLYDTLKKKSRGKPEKMEKIIKKREERTEARMRFRRIQRIV